MPSKKDFVATAKIIKTERDRVRSEKENDEACVLYTLASNARVARAMADQFAAANPAFNRDRFLAACGVHDV